MRKDKVHDEASETEAVEGVVVVEGPDNVAILLTPAAADTTADRLKETAGHARGQVKPD
jgi:hypothetical protein